MAGTALLYVLYRGGGGGGEGGEFDGAQYFLQLKINAGSSAQYIMIIITSFCRAHFQFGQDSAALYDLHRREEKESLKVLNIMCSLNAHSSAQCGPTL